MGEGLPAADLFKAHLQTGSRQALGIDREQQHLSGGQIGVEEGRGGLHLVGLYAGGPLYEGFADSRGQRNWQHVDNFHFEWCLYHERDRAVNGVETSFVRSLEHVGGFGGKADRLNEYHFLAGTPGWVRQDLARYQKVNGEGVVDVARRWLMGRPVVWLSVVPRGRADLAAGSSAGEGRP